MEKYDYLIVGAGLFGATFAWHATQAGKRCLIIDKRIHTGGNVYCETVNGIHVHRYGPHIFHTSNKKVWEFVNRFVTFNRFTLNTKASYKGEIYSLPFNMNTFHEMWGTVTPTDAQNMIEKQRYRGEVHNLEDQAKRLVGHDIYEKLIKGYTEKQWGRPCCELPPFIIRRLPVRLTYDNNYFNDDYQGIPIGGYNPLVEKLLEGSDVRTGTDFFNGLDKEWQNIAGRLVFTGRIDDFFHCRYGKLIMESYCMHGNGSGSTDVKPVFSNMPGSHASSIGVYVLCGIGSKNMKTSIRLEGLDSTNSNARPRGILIHSSWKTFRFHGQI